MALDEGAEGQPSTESRGSTNLNQPDAQTKQSRSYFQSLGISNDIVLAFEKAGWTIDLMLDIETESELSGFLADVSQHRSVSNVEKIKLKRMIRTLRKNIANIPNVANNLHSTSPLAQMKQPSLTAKDHIESMALLSKRISSLQELESSLRGTQDKIIANEAECRKVVVSGFDQILRQIEQKRSEILLKTQQLFEETNDSVAISEHLDLVQKELKKCQTCQSQQSQTMVSGARASPLSNASGPNASQSHRAHSISLQECVQPSLELEASLQKCGSVADAMKQFKRCEISASFGTQSNQTLTRSIAKAVNQIELSYAFISSNIEDDEKSDGKAVSASDYVRGVVSALKRMESKETARLPTLKEVKMMFPRLSIKNGIIALAGSADLYDVANDTGGGAAAKNDDKMDKIDKNEKNNKAPGASEEKEANDSKDVKNGNGKQSNTPGSDPNEDLNKNAVFGERAKKLYLALIADIREHYFDPNPRYGALLRLKLARYKDSLLHELVTAQNLDKLVVLIKKGSAVLEGIRKGAYRLTNEEINFMQLACVDVGQAVGSVRSTKLLLLLKQSEQSQIPFIQEKKALMAQSLQASRGVGNIHDKSKYQDIANMVQQARNLRRRERYENTILRRIVMSSLKNLKKIAQDGVIPFYAVSDKEFGPDHKKVMLFCVECQIAMIEAGNVSNVLHQCGDVMVLKEFRRICICYGDPSQKYGVCIARYKFDKNVPSYYSEVEHIVESVDARIEQVQTSMLL